MEETPWAGNISLGALSDRTAHWLFRLYQPTEALCPREHTAAANWERLTAVTSDVAFCHNKNEAGRWLGNFLRGNESAL